MYGGKNHARFPHMQKCMGKKSCPISAYAEMYGGKKHARFPHMQKCMGEKIIPDFRICRNVWGKKTCPISAYAEMYWEKKSCPISTHTKMNNIKNDVQFLYRETNVKMIRN